MYHLHKVGLIRLIIYRYYVENVTAAKDQGIQLMFYIADYDERYRPYDKSGGELRNPEWVKLPAKPKGDGLQALLEQKRGLEIFAIWCLILEKTTAEKKPENRGKLLNHRDKPATISEIAKSISLPTRAILVKTAINTLISMGWIIAEEASESSEQTSAKSIVVKSKVKLSKDKNKYLEFVLLTDEEYKKLCDRFGKSVADSYIERLNNYLGSKGKKYKSHYHTILNWINKDGVDKKQSSPPLSVDSEGKTPRQRALEQIERLRNE